ncbi:hypothetical protein [Bacillus fungorum]
MGIRKAQSFAERLCIKFGKEVTESTAIGTNEASPTEIARVICCI